MKPEQRSLPLWLGMLTAWGLWAAKQPKSADDDWDESEGPGWAEVVESVRYWLLPEEEPEPDYLCGDLGWIVNTEEAIRCDERQRLRAMLTEQARIAREHPNGQYSQQGPEGD